MQISRLFEMVYLLLERKSIPARELAERFEVSTRTIYRDVETLSLSGIPIYAERGKGGGISLMEGFILNKSVLTDLEQQEVLASLQGLSAVRGKEAREALGKLSALFGRQEEDWIEVDFSSWNPEDALGERFEFLKRAILNRQVLTLSYSSAKGETQPRVVEPHRLVFRGYDWYLLAWCRERKDFRYFKLTRMDRLEAAEEHFERKQIPSKNNMEAAPPQFHREWVTARVSANMAYRLADEFSPEAYEREPSGSFLLHMNRNIDHWLYQYLMTYGADLEVLEPQRVREELSERHRKAWEKYKI